MQGGGLPRREGEAPARAGRGRPPGRGEAPSWGVAPLRGGARGLSPVAPLAPPGCAAPAFGRFRRSAAHFPPRGVPHIWPPSASQAARPPLRPHPAARRLSVSPSRPGRRFSRPKMAKIDGLTTPARRPGPESRLPFGKTAGRVGQLERSRATADARSPFSVVKSSILAILRPRSAQAAPPGGGAHAIPAATSSRPGPAFARRRFAPFPMTRCHILTPRFVAYCGKGCDGG